MHSHDYKNNREFKDKRVCLLGASFSGFDLVREISQMSSKTYYVARTHSTEDEASGPKENIWNIGGTISSISGNDINIEGDDENIKLEGIDIIVFCTGYKYDFPFLKSLSDLQYQENMVYPLYKHMFYVPDPSLIFIGIPQKIVPFTIFEMQAMFA